MTEYEKYIRRGYSPTDAKEIIKSSNCPNLAERLNRVTVKVKGENPVSILRNRFKRLRK